MPFDLSTAKAVNGGGFDLSTAKKIDEPDSQAEPAFQQAMPDDPIFYGLPQETIDKIKDELPDIPVEDKSNDSFAAIGAGLTGGMNDPQKTQQAKQESMANLERLRIENPYMAEEIEDMSDLHAATIGAGRFFSTVGSGAKRILGQNSDQENQTLKDDTDRYEQLAGIKNSTTAGNLAAQIPTYAVGGMTTAAVKNTLPRVLAGGAIGGAEGAIPALGEGASAGEAVKRGAVGAILNVAANEAPRFLKRKENAATAMKQDIKAGPNKDLVRYDVDAADNIVKNKKVASAASEGWDEGFLDVAKRAQKGTKEQMKKMLRKHLGGMNDQKYGLREPRTNVIGDSLKKRLDDVVEIRKAAGAKFEALEESLKSKPVDPTAYADDFLNDLRKLDIEISPDVKQIKFQNSMLEGDKFKDLQTAINGTINRMRATKTPNAYDAHRLKRYLDQQINFDRPPEGLSGQIEVTLRKLRANINKTVAEASPEYKAVNKQYSDAKRSIKQINKTFGTKIDIDDPRSVRQFGITSRRIASNAVGGSHMMNAIDDLESTAMKYGKAYDDSIDDLVLLEEAMKKRFGSQQTASFQGDIAKNTDRLAQSLSQSKTKNALDFMSKASQKVSGKTDKTAIKSLEDLLAD
ncbi:MAG: hypothetical protein ACRBCS_03200 [Cellvibrionaceae bacterium]